MIWCECASPSGSVLTTRLISPCVQRVTALERCWPVRRKPRPAKSGRQPLGLVLGDGELDPLDRLRRGAGRHGAGAHAVHQPDQRPLAVLGDALRRGHAEAVVEDLERQPAVVAGGQHRLEEVADRQVALAGKVAEVARPLQQVHVHARRVGELDEGHAVGGDRADRVAGQAARQDVPAVEDQPDRGVVGAAHDLPRVAVVGDVAAPGQRLEPDLDAEAAGDVAHRAQVLGRAVDAALRRGRDVGADEDTVGAELGHQPELAPRALETARALRLGHALEVAERLEGDDVEAVVADDPPDLARRGLVRQHVGLEDLDPLEAGAGDGGELLGQRAAERDGGDGKPHASSVRAWRSRASSMGRPWKIPKAWSPW